MGAALVVEDNVVIGLDVEDMLRALGFSDVDVAVSAAEAERMMAARRFDFAVLDVNLGPDETSIPVALALQEQGVPFVFASGYGDDAPRPEPLRPVKVLRKPYRPEDLANAAKAAGVEPR